MKSALLAIGMMVFTSHALANEPAHWSYEGEVAPQYWSKLNPDYMLCEKGKNQSPINIHNSMKVHARPLHVNYQMPPVSLINNGHSIQANVQEGDVVLLDGDKFTLQQFHFHSPSENTINGKSFPLEAHFVNMDADGEIAVIAVMFKIGKANPALTQISQQLPKDIGETVVLKQKVDIKRLLPESLTHYRYNGSLTTPPCTEGVRWMVVKQPLTLSAEQLTWFTSAMHHANNRPLQDLHGRVVLDD
ncbi:carbonic anhydrase [Ewingella sp. S1.OA.A_B6]